MVPVSSNSSAPAGSSTASSIQQSIPPEPCTHHPWRAQSASFAAVPLWVTPTLHPTRSTVLIIWLHNFFVLRVCKGTRWVQQGPPQALSKPTQVNGSSPIKLGPQGICLNSQQPRKLITFLCWFHVAQLVELFQKTLLQV